MKKIATILSMAVLVACNATAQQPATIQANSAPKNIIMIVGDGMGPAYTSAYRYFADDPKTPEIEQTVFDRHLIGVATTYPAPISGYITDSAAAATALSTGVKTYNSAIAVDVDGKPLETVLERAKAKGKKTGVVVTSQINHATPASYLAHNASRRNYNEIADSYLDDGIKADVYLGGGWQYFIRDERNLVEQFQAKGFHYVDNYSQLAQAPANKPLLGLFGKKGLPWAVDDNNKHRLSMMTKMALPHLENDKGFFLLIEASQIDWAGHANDIAAAMHEMDDLAKTIEFLETYVANNPDTLVVITADHSTGGLSIGRKTAATNPKLKTNYLWQPEIIRTIKMSPDTFGKQYAAQAMTLNEIKDALNIELTEEEYQQIESAKQQGIVSAKAYQETPKAQRTSKYPPTVYKSIANALKDIIDVKTNTGWGSISESATHTAVDVPVFAMGPQKSRFSGVINNIDIANNIFKLLEDK